MSDKFTPLVYKVEPDTQKRIFRTIFDNMTEWFRLGFEAFEIEVRLWKSKRTFAQNKRLWAIYKVFASSAWANGRLYTSDEWHEAFKDKFLPKEEYRNPVTGETAIRPISTRQLDTEEMANYQNELQAYGAQYFGIEWEF